MTNIAQIIKVFQDYRDYLDELEEDYEPEDDRPVTMTITEHGPAPVSPNVPRAGGVTVTLPNADAMAKTVYR